MPLPTRASRSNTEHMPPALRSPLRLLFKSHLDQLAIQAPQADRHAADLEIIFRRNPRLEIVMLHRDPPPALALARFQPVEERRQTRPLAVALLLLRRDRLAHLRLGRHAVGVQLREGRGSHALLVAFGEHEEVRVGRQSEGRVVLVRGRHAFPQPEAR